MTIVVNKKMATESNKGRRTRGPPPLISEQIFHMVCGQSLISPYNISRILENVPTQIFAAIRAENHIHKRKGKKK